MCQVCQTLETMSHILTKCKANGQAQMWQLAQKLWFKKDKTDLAISLGTILASPSDQRKQREKKWNQQAVQDYNVRVSTSNLESKM